MDWSNKSSPFLVPDPNDDAFKTFSYDADSQYSCRRLYSNGDKVEECILKNDADWSDWFNTTQFQALQSLPRAVGNEDRGYEILLSPHVSDEVLQVRATARDVETDLSDLPISRPNWITILENFFIHRAIYSAMQSRPTPGYSAYFKTTATSGTGNCADVEVFIASSSQTPSPFAVAATYDPESNFTTAVFLGLDQGQMKRLHEILKAYPQYRGCRLLVMGLFAELERDRLDNRAEKLKDETDGISGQFETYRSQGVEPKIGNWILQTRLRQARLNAALTREDIRGTQAHLKTLIARIDKPLVDKSVPSANTATSEDLAIGEDLENARKFKLRFEEICLEYDAFMATCQYRSDDMSFARDLCMAEISAREAKASKALGFAAMIYLPMSSLATIFAMPIFDWKARWLDHNQHFVPTNSSDDSSSGSSQTSTDDPGPFVVLSGYFWIYLGVTIVTTVFTVALYMLYAWDWKIRPKLEIVEAKGKVFLRVVIHTVGSAFKRSMGKSMALLRRKGSSGVSDGTELDTIRDNRTVRHHRPGNQPPNAHRAGSTRVPEAQTGPPGSGSHPSHPSSQLPWGLWRPGRASTVRVDSTIRSTTNTHSTSNPLRSISRTAPTAPTNPNTTTTRDFVPPAPTRPPPPPPVLPPQNTPPSVTAPPETQTPTEIRTPQVEPSAQGFTVSTAMSGTSLEIPQPSVIFPDIALTEEPAFNSPDSNNHPNPDSGQASPSQLLTSSAQIPPGISGSPLAQPPDVPTMPDNPQELSTSTGDEVPSTTSSTQTRMFMLSSDGTVRHRGSTTSPLERRRLYRYRR